ncbi:hypothetical protein [Dietzia natronolimnaea]|uniref:hypothetical protein n=1 Tax=Dietzia natronolimnaea TaxID=161920 RepID=UPI0015F992F6|nr:hypothetical protein [Dietzia natronolimnaea]MBB1037351.1 hypothetical protein [Dietzia natronolimnaea]
MGFKQVRTSDLTGAELDDDEVITVTVKAAGKVFDTSAEEIKGLKRLNNVVQLEFRHSDGTSEMVLTTQADFDKLVPPDKVETFDKVRGRRSGFSPRREQ